MQPQSQSQFKYEHCFNNNTNDLNKKIWSVEFNISRYGLYTRLICFTFPITVTEAIRRVEEYLSQPLTREIYDEIRDDLFLPTTWPEDKQYLNTISDCLGDAVNLEVLEFQNNDSRVRLITAS